MVILVVAVSVTLCIGLDAQHTMQIVEPRPLAESAERLARELWPTDGEVTVNEGGRPVFRVNVTGRDVALPLPWQVSSTVPKGFRPRGGNMHHHEFLAAVTPQEFRSSVLYPAGVTIDPAAIARGIASVWRTFQERRIRERIASELEQLRVRSSGSRP
jgi:hypothetical protein